ncbi:VWA domain-containing protein [Silicimonas algicola]|uniref:Ca-activated chloride channel family protein n=1 Tax=Silicimonas algicola TaxID=1826607 RepID=A0A316G2K2_9RHOB|nr:VWA domain-containing protein [Silicimonas algicola]AZQ69114.1 VWA domain-containing protein [Silicimonas algicola]PWK55079.1 Ca-activated chloride channel family protein [Silicimonas algicola]
MSLPDLTLLRPLWLLAFVPLALSGWHFWRKQGALGDWVRVADRDLLSAMARFGWVDPGGTRRPLLLLLCAAAAVVIALAGPAVQRRDTLSFRNLDGVLFVVDASPDLVKTSSWQDLLFTGRYGIGALQSRPGGIIVYAGDAYVATDMTQDHLQLGQTLSLIGAETVPDAGTRPDRALDLAAEMLREADILAGDVILLTDGTGLGPDSLRATEAITATGARLSVVAASEPGPEMEAHAALGQGMVFAPRDLEAFGEFLEADARTRLERQDMPLLFWRDLGRVFVFLALVPLALLLTRSGP